ncbi:unnamed protein product [Urochloa humidicola]
MSAEGSLDLTCRTRSREEELESQKRGVLSKPDIKDTSKPSSRGFTAGDKAKGSFKKDEAKKLDKSNSDTKWSSLLAYRKANGLCYTCGEKWTGKLHKCPNQVPLHVVQELMEVLQLESQSDTDSSSCEEDLGEVCVVATQHSSQHSTTKKKRKTMRFQGMIGKQEVTILLDSGSVATFISTDLADNLKSQVQSCETLKYTTADGAPMVSDTYIPNLQWFIQGHTFTYDARVLPLRCFDMIIGAD